MRTLIAGVALALLLAGGASAEEFVSLFDGKSLDGWFIVNKKGPGFIVENGLLVCPANGGQKLMTDKEYENFIFRFEFRLEADGNNGIGIRTPRDGHTSTQGMEIQILDQSGPKYGPMKLRPEQYHGSIYDVIPARTGFLRKPGEWNQQEIEANGRRISVRLNGVLILDANLDMVQEPEVLKKHPGLNRRSGHIALLGHQSPIEFRNLQLKVLP
ncbi:MAG: 3-keto-disaccharide hydrolase [Bryobacteraceae bacterium]